MAETAIQTFVVRGPQEATEPRLFNRTESFRFLDKAGCLQISSLALPDSGVRLARVRSTGHEILLEEPDRVSIILPWSGTVRSEVNGDVFGAGATGVLVLNPNRRRTTVARRALCCRPSDCSLTGRLEACRQNRLPLSVNPHLLMAHLPVVGDLRRLISKTLTRFDHDPDPAAPTHVLRYVTATLADALVQVAAVVAAPPAAPASQVAGGSAKPWT